MLDFLMISTRSTKRGVAEIYPRFKITKTQDLMIRGSDFYAIWDEERGLWSTDEQDALNMIDRQLDIYANEYKQKFEGTVKVLYMWDAESGMIDRWHKYCQKQMRDSFHMLDEKLIFANTEVKKEDYASKVLPYPLESCPTPAYEELVSTLYSPEEKEKLEWAIGSIVSGDSKKIQKFIVLYGAAGTGKSTVLNIIQDLFQGYYSVFDAKALGSSSNSFALESFKSNPLVAIQHDGDLSRIEDNTRLNSLVSHELMTVNEKFKSTYSNRFKSFLFMGTNKPVKITDAKSGLIRRLIDVSPTGNKVPMATYKKLMNQIQFELGGIAKHCQEVYLDDPGKYDSYIPKAMLGASNDFYNFVEDSYYIFKNDDQVTLKAAWEMYKTYCSDANVAYPFSQRIFKEELKNYFWDFSERVRLEDDTRIRNVYSGFRADKFDNDVSPVKQEPDDLIVFKKQKSIFDKEAESYPAQYANDEGTPSKRWSEVKTTLKDIDTSKLHYVKVPKNHIVIDFDICDENGKKSYQKNLEEASKWPNTYAELSKSGAAIHLHYIYDGDVDRLKNVYDDHIEIKVFKGNSSLRRKLTKCNNQPIATINSGLPLKGEKKMDLVSFKNEKGLRTLIKKNLNKEYHPGTKPSIDFIFKILEEAYDSGVSYDVSDMRGSIFTFASNSTNQAEYCMKLVNKMHFKSEELENKENKTKPIMFFDVEVFPNLFVLCAKIRGDGYSVMKFINPDSHKIEELISGYNLVGFNNRRYDNHILYGRLLGYNNEQLYDLSQNIINGSPNCFFGDAYNLSYTDIYDFSSKKQSLKKFEIELGIHHLELGLPWDKPVDEKYWETVADYCCNDVTATEAVFEARYSDFIAREILADVAGMTVNDTTNSLTTRIIFGTNRKPQDQFNYRDMGDISDAVNTIPNTDPEFTRFDSKNRPVFPGYSYDAGKSIYRDEEVGEGGYVYSEPGIYRNVALLDIASQHPSSIIAEELFGPEYTSKFNDILQARIAIKHKDFKSAKKMLGGKLAKYLDDEAKAKDLAQALKIAINSVYGLTAARFDNPFRDIRNKDNIVAKRGALFMINLKHEVQRRGYTVAHIKTDSIKIPDADDYIINFVTRYGKLYGYNFEHEATYDRMCLVNDAVYIAKDSETGWTATGTQFQVPYVFKTLFSHEPIKFSDLCETKSVTTNLYLVKQENLIPIEKLKSGQSWVMPDDDDMYYRDGSDIYKVIESKFVGKVGSFCPVKDGYLLMREKDRKLYTATGAKGYLWKEAEVVKELGQEDNIDISYYEKLADAAIAEINKYGNYEDFIN